MEETIAATTTTTMKAIPTAAATAIDAAAMAALSSFGRSARTASKAPNGVMVAAMGSDSFRSESARSNLFLEFAQVWMESTLASRCRSRTLLLRQAGERLLLPGTEGSGRE